MIEDLVVAFLTRYNYYMAVIIMLIGLYAMIAKSNLIKKVIGLNIFQTAIYLFYISIADVKGGTAPILVPGTDVVYVNPLPHVLILTAIVVGVSITAVAYALAIRIYQSYGKIEEDELLELGANPGDLRAPSHPGRRPTAGRCPHRPPRRMGGEEILLSGRRCRPYGPVRPLACNPPGGPQRRHNPLLPRRLGAQVLN